MKRLGAAATGAAWIVAAIAVWGCPVRPLGERETPPDPPARNLVVVLADTLRAANLGVYGYERDTSPNLAALAAEGILFEQARSQAPCTYPSANSILTGLDGTRFWIQEDVRVGIPEGIPTLAERLAARGWSTVAVSASPIVRKSPSENNRFGGFDRGFGAFDESCLWGDADCVNRAAFGYLRTAQEPLFLYLHYMDPHDPWRPSRPRFSASGYTGREFVAAGDPNPFLDLVYGDPPRPDDVPESDRRHLEALYDDEILDFDEALGALVAELKGLGLWEDTLLVVVADHGEEFLEHGHLKHCNSLYDTEIRTPMVLRIPGGPSGRRESALTQNLDLVPTVLDYLGVEVDDAALDGRSLRPTIERGEPIHDIVISAYGSLRAVVSEEHKLIMDLATGRVELFDLAADPGETTNVAADHPRIVRELQSSLSRWMRETERASSPEEALRRGQAAAERLRSLGYVR